MAQYLYGAAVQGIQGFIFQTDKLREIVGASELVERICTELFAKVLYNYTPTPQEDAAAMATQLLSHLKADENAILNAAGNIKYIFDNEEECRRVARIFPKTVMQFAPGITISQSVVKVEPDKFKEAVQQLEKNLRTQRNKQMRDLSIGLIGIRRSRDTGLPVTHLRDYDNKTNYLDSATYHKLFDEKGKRKETFKLLCKKAFGDCLPLETEKDIQRLPLDIKDMTSSNDWIAIIHADGNGLGQVVQRIGTDKDKFREFSRLLDEATTEAAVKAFEETIKPKLSENDSIPIRPIVLGGDDLTVICRADLAIPYTQAFLRSFEEKTHAKLGDTLLGKKSNGKYGAPIFNDKSDFLTACAGIAFIKSSFPFHFGYQLAESLCDRAKKDTKAIFDATNGNLPASCLMFHKVQDSFVTDYESIAERELRPADGISFEFGPYYLNKDRQPGNLSKDKFKQRWTIGELISSLEKLKGKDGNAVKSNLRNWLTLLHDNPAMADQKLKRILDIISVSMKEYVESITTSFDNSKVYPVYDILSIHTINNQTTR
ncbi:MAG: CRISPR-associated protein [Bacteroides sp.]|nr:CRISPR-associated protein [Bacteroides sp.]